jgi:hypothetical protein
MHEDLFLDFTRLFFLLSMIPPSAAGALPVLKQTLVIMTSLGIVSTALIIYTGNRNRYRYRYSNFFARAPNSRYSYWSERIRYHPGLRER